MFTFVSKFLWLHLIATPSMRNEHNQRIFSDNALLHFYWILKSLWKSSGMLFNVLDSYHNKNHDDFINQSLTKHLMWDIELLAVGLKKEKIVKRLACRTNYLPPTSLLPVRTLAHSFEWIVCYLPKKNKQAFLWLYRRLGCAKKIQSKYHFIDAYDLIKYVWQKKAIASHMRSDLI